MYIGSRSRSGLHNRGYWVGIRNWDWDWDGMEIGNWVGIEWNWECEENWWVLGWDFGIGILG
jgi:hypothetical protein